MTATTLVVKNMVCHRCVLAVTTTLQQLQIPFQQVTIGEIQLQGVLAPLQLQALAAALAITGLELLNIRATGTVEKIKQLVIKRARNEVADCVANTKLSAYLSAELHYEYTYLSSLFSAAEGRTIESFFIEQRVEKVKELLVYNEMTLAHIAFDMGYSSVAHMSNQFRQVTGLTLGHFRKVGKQKRKLIDTI